MTSQTAVSYHSTRHYVRTTNVVRNKHVATARIKRVIGLEDPF